MASTTWATIAISSSKRKVSTHPPVVFPIMCSARDSILRNIGQKGLLLTVPGAKMNKILENLPSWLDKHASVQILVVLLAHIMFHSSIRGFLDVTLCIYKTSYNSANRKFSFLILLPQLVVVSLNFNTF